MSAGQPCGVPGYARRRYRLGCPGAISKRRGHRVRYDPVEALLAMDLTPTTCVVLMSVAHRLDLPAVQGLRRRPLRYLGMMGNRGRVATCFATLAEEGFTKEEIGRLHAPIGLNVGAECPSRSRSPS